MINDLKYHQGKQNLSILLQIHNTIDNYILHCPPTDVQISLPNLGGIQPKVPSKDITTFSIPAGGNYYLGASGPGGYHSRCKAIYRAGFRNHRSFLKTSFDDSESVEPWRSQQALSCISVGVFHQQRLVRRVAACCLFSYSRTIQRRGSMCNKEFCGCQVGVRKAVQNGGTACRL